MSEYDRDPLTLHIEARRRALATPKQRPPDLRAALDEFEDEWDALPYDEDRGVGLMDAMPSSFVDAKDRLLEVARAAATSSADAPVGGIDHAGEGPVPTSVQNVWNEANPVNTLREAIEASMQDIGLGTDERLARAEARVEAVVLAAIDAVKLSEDSLLPGNNEWADGFRQGWLATRDAALRLAAAHPQDHPEPETRNG